MTGIEITTAHNVTIRYRLAGAGRRFMAYCIDMSIIVMAFVLYKFIVLAMDVMTPVFDMYLFAGIFFFYTPLSEIISNGYTIGKKLIKIKIVKINGEEAGIEDFLIRWSFRIIDIYFSLGSLAVMLISSTDKGQRLGDIIAHTTVINIAPEKQYSLNHLLRMEEMNDYKPLYVEVIQMKDNEMMVVKSTLDRLRAYPNKANTEAAQLLCDVLKKRLQIREVTGNNKEFLQRLISDYVMLTR